MRKATKHKMIRYTALVLWIGLMITAGVVFMQYQKEQKRLIEESLAAETATEPETEPPVLVDLMEGFDNPFDQSHLAGYCGTGSFTKAIAKGECGVDFSKIPTKTDLLKEELDAWGHPYILDGERFFIFYFQDHGKKWENLPHGAKTVAKTGCGTVSLSMVLTSLTGNYKKYSPDKLAKFLIKEHIAPPNRSQRSILVLNEMMNTGCTIKLHHGELNFDLVDKCLKKGGYIILDQRAWAPSHGNRVFGAKNHYIVIRGGNQKKGYYIANSLYGYSKKNSKAEYYAPQNYTRIPAKRFCSVYYYTCYPPKDKK